MAQISKVNIIYGIRAKYDVSMEYRYVGLTSIGELRFKQHHSESSNPNDARYHLPKSRWMRKHRHLVVYDILEVCGSVEELPLCEVKWIHILRERGHRLLNLTDGGEGTFGWRAPEEWRQRASARMQGTGNHQYGLKGELSPNYGRKGSEEFRQLTSSRQQGERNSFYGRKHTPENMKLYVEKSSGENNVRAKLTDEKVREIRNLRDNGIHAIEVAKQFGVHRDTVDKIYTRRSWKHVD